MLGRVFADRPHDFQRGTADEDRDTSEQRSSLWFEQSVAPGDCVSHGAVPLLHPGRSGVQQTQARIELRQQLARGKNGDPGCRQLDGEG
jgi:hypothetical protein